jgi:hypothetical protein
LVRREGQITDELEACLTFRDEDELLYALTGELGSLGAGDQVTIEGVYLETSSCMEGSTIEVVRAISGRERP